MRKNVSLTPPIELRAEEIIKRRGFTGLSDMIAVLVREEYERRFPSIDPAEQLNETSSAQLEAAQRAAVEIAEAHYGKKKRVKKKHAQ